jgi:hypothetical protein
MASGYELAGRLVTNRVSDGVEKAILAGACFRGMEDLFRNRPPVISTRVGYTGGDVPNTTFYLDEQQRRVAEETIADVDASGRWPAKVVTELTPGAVLGSRVRALELPRAKRARLHLPLCSPGLRPALFPRRLLLWATAWRVRVLRTCRYPRTPGAVAG